MPQTDVLPRLCSKTEARLAAVAGSTRGLLGLHVTDLAGGWEFGINDHEPFPQASAIKIPILMEVFQQAAAGKINLGENRRIEKGDKTGGSGILAALGNGTVSMSLHDLCVMTIVLSDNTATNLLIDLVGMDQVNKTMESLGLRETWLRRRMMDTAASRRGDENLSTPAEAARIMALLHRGEFVSRAVCDDILEILRIPKTTTLGAGLPTGTVIASKPGGIPGVHVEWALVPLERRPYILTVMENFSLGQDATTAMKEVSRIVHEHFQRLADSTGHGVLLPSAPSARD